MCDLFQSPAELARGQAFLQSSNPMAYVVRLWGSGRWFLFFGFLFVCVFLVFWVLLLLLFVFLRPALLVWPRLALMMSPLTSSYTARNPPEIKRQSNL
ncbi:rCG39119, partial [Rattus norvegicus]